MNEHTIFSRIFDAINYFVLTLLALLAVIPFVHIVAGSFSTPELLLQKTMVLFPTKFSLDAYRYIFSTNTVLRSLGITIYITVLGTIVNIFFTAMMAYPLSNTLLPGRRIITFMVVFTMLFSGGMIPSFLVIKSLKLINTLWALVIPGAINAFNLIILKNFFQQIPKELEESARIDGCSEMRILFSIILPLSKPVLATLTLFYAVGHWNTFMAAILYINDSKMWPIQVLLRQMVLLSQIGTGDSHAMGESFVIPPQTVKMATIFVATAPILMVYPFLQKHFVKGIFMGSVKG